MKKNFLSILYQIVGIILSIISLVSGKKQILNFGDTYYIIECSNFSVFLFFLFSIISFTYFLIRNYYNRIIGKIQIISFFIPVIYFMIYDLITEKFSPGYYFSHPIVYNWQTIYIPMVLFFVFCGSIILLVCNLIVALIKYYNKKRKLRIQK